MRIGGRSEKLVDVRFVAATHKSLESEIAANRFRADLYYRLAGMTIRIPPLRERRDEIAPLARFFAVRIAERLDVEELPMRERRAQVLLTLAKAHAIRARHADAVLALLAAEDYAPQVVRYSGQAHEIVRMIVKRKKVKAIPQLRGLVDRLGVTTWPT